MRCFGVARVTKCFQFLAVCIRDAASISVSISLTLPAEHQKRSQVAGSNNQPRQPFCKHGKDPRKPVPGIPRSKVKVESAVELCRGMSTEVAVLHVV